MYVLTYSRSSLIRRIAKLGCHKQGGAQSPRHRPHKAGKQSFIHIESTIQKVVNLKKNVYILRDCNDDQQKNNTLGSTLRRLKLEQSIQTPTRIADDGGCSLVALIITTIFSTYKRPSLSGWLRWNELRNCSAQGKLEGYSKDSLKLYLQNRVLLLNKMRNAVDANDQSAIFQKYFLKTLDKVSPIVAKT